MSDDDKNVISNKFMFFMAFGVPLIYAFLVIPIYKHFEENLDNFVLEYIALIIMWSTISFLIGRILFRKGIFTNKE